jgi:hypothetical protein
VFEGCSCHKSLVFFSLFVSWGTLSTPTSWLLFTVRLQQWQLFVLHSHYDDPWQPILWLLFILERRSNFGGHLWYSSFCRAEGVSILVVLPWVVSCSLHQVVLGISDRIITAPRVFSTVIATRSIQGRSSWTNPLDWVELVIREALPWVLPTGRESTLPLFILSIRVPILYLQLALDRVCIPVLLRFHWNIANSIRTLLVQPFTSQLVRLTLQIVSNSLITELGHLDWLPLSGHSHSKIASSLEMKIVFWWHAQVHRAFCSW